MILIAYDGTPSADRAIEVAGALCTPGSARVVHFWAPQPAVTEAMGVSVWAVGDEIEADVARQEAEARAVAAAGAEHARRAGFDAEGMAVRHPGSAAAALEQTVDELRPDLVVLGSRGLTGLKALLKGSTSHHVGTHAHAPVLIVPPEPEEARGDAASAGP